MTVLLLTSNPSAWGQAPQFDRQTLLRVPLTTDAAQFAACERLGSVRDSSPEDLRKKILRLGGDAGLVTFDLADPDKINAEVYRCQKKVAPGPAPAGAVGDPTPSHRALLGTWIGTLSTQPVLSGYAQRGSQFPATVRMWEEDGQLHWTMEVGASGLNSKGTGTFTYGEVTLTGASGTSRDGRPGSSYSLRLSGQTLEGSGVGPDNIIRTLSLRKQP